MSRLDAIGMGADQSSENEMEELLKEAARLDLSV